MDEPLIYTIKGNLPISSLQYCYWWEENENEVAFHETYSLNGEIVKESSHRKLKKGPTLQVHGGAFG